ncbi:MAG TPA: transferrin receptor-like dimerization domain-containing protein [Vicinamibacterales bacterium]|nr:transferrin receptor-like dimerization domain-containing protein [Vicinamibacterales bacterium]
MRLTTPRVLVLLGAAALITGGASAILGAQQKPGIFGFSPAEAKTELSWEQKFRAIPEPANIRANMEHLSSEPHNVGSPQQHVYAEWILNKFKSYGLDAHIEEFRVLFPTPAERKVELISPVHYEAKLKEPPVPGDPTSGQATQLPTYNAYSADGDVTAPLVYVNYGVPEDYAQLAKMGISVKGKIVIARYGRSWRGIKPKLAHQHGAIGCIIYSDPRDDGYYQGNTFPEGPFRPEWGVQRGSVMEMERYPGDPETPGWGSTPGAKRLPLNQVTNLEKIPVLPISWGDALPLLKALGGPMAPDSWRGALPIPYHVGPGPATVHLVVKSNWNVVPAYDVIAKITGSTYPNEWVIRGNHYDGWVNGAADPISGQSSLLEEARAYGELMKEGWRPKRTIIYCAWDGEEPGLLGSTEWAETHEAELQKDGVVYINSDTNGKGYLSMEGSHTLEHFVNQVAKAITDPETGESVWIKLDTRDRNRARTPQQMADIFDGNDLHMGALGSGSDYSAFLQHVGMPTLALSYGGEDPGGVYHSIYDDFYWYTHFGDTTFEYGRALAQTYGTAIMRLADADVLPFQFSDFADTVARYETQLEALAKGPAGMPGFDFVPLTQAITTVQDAAHDYDAAAAAAMRDGRVFRKSPAELATLNQLLYHSEQKLLSPAGLPQRPWYKHTIYAPGYYTGYGVKTMPGVREALERKDFKTAAAQETALADALNAFAAQIRQATAQVQD